MNLFRSDRSKWMMGAAGVVLTFVLLLILEQTGPLERYWQALRGQESDRIADELEMRARKLPLKSEKVSSSEAPVKELPAAESVDSLDAAIRDEQLPYRIYLMPGDDQWQAGNPGAVGALKSGFAVVQRGLAGCIALRVAGNSAMKPFSMDARLVPNTTSLAVTGLALNIAPDQQPEVACLRDRLQSTGSSSFSELSSALAAPLKFRIVIVPVAAGPSEPK